MDMTLCSGIKYQCYAIINKNILVSSPGHMIQSALIILSNVPVMN